MKHYTLPLLTIGIGIVVAVLHSAALAYHLYFIYWWFDMPVHFLGGMTVALFLIWGSMRVQGIALLKSPSYPLFLHVMLFTITIGFLWETFELMYHITLTTRHGYALDTLSDMTTNIIGALVGYGIGVRLLRNYEPNI